MGDLISPWHPMKDPVDLKSSGKLIEECGELISAMARCQIQGIDETEPVTGKVNRRWLEEEIADVLANIDIVRNRFNLNTSFIEDRKSHKICLLEVWHAKA